MWRTLKELIRKDPDVRKDWRQEEKGMTEYEMVWCHHWLKGYEFEQAPGVGDGQGSLACYGPWGHRVGHNWATEVNWYLNIHLGLLGDSDGKKICLPCRRPGFDPCVGEIPWRREWLPTPVFLPGEFHGQRSLEGLQSMESQRAGHHWITNTFTYLNKNNEKKDDVFSINVSKHQNWSAFHFYQCMSLKNYPQCWRLFLPDITRV